MKKGMTIADLTKAKPMDIKDEFPFLMEVEEIKKKNFPDMNRMLHYILLAYHPESPLIQTNTSSTSRKEKAAAMAGYNRSITRDANMINNIFDHSNKDFTDILDGFLRYINNRVWNIIVVNEYMFYEYQRKLITPLDEGADKSILQAADIKSKLRKEMDDIHAKLDVYYQQFYQGDEKAAMEARTKRKAITAESIAKKNVLSS